MGCKMSKRRTRKGNQKREANDGQGNDQQAPDLNDISTLKRAQLQKLCKKYKIKANGKNTELLSRLQDHLKEIQRSNKNLSSELSSPSSEDLSSVTLNGQPHCTENTSQEERGFAHTNKQTISENAGNSMSEISMHQSKSQISDGDDHIDTAGVKNDIALNEKNSVEAQLKPKKSCESRQSSPKWCVVEGILKDDEGNWQQIVLSGGRPMVCNRFGKLIPFILEPSLTAVPTNVQDNFICGSCRMKNEELRKKDVSRPRMQASRRLTGRKHENTSSNFSRNFLSGSVKRKRRECEPASMKRRRKEPEVSSRPLTPANPKVRRARGQEVTLAKNIKKPWKPRRGSSSLKENQEFARRVEAIINSTEPGSLEEMNMVMRATKSPVQHSPTKV